MRNFKVVLESTARIRAEVFINAENADDAEEKAIKSFHTLHLDWQVDSEPTYSDEVYINEVEEVTE